MYSVTDPATGELVEEIENASDEQVRAAIGRVHAGFSAWRRRTVAERCRKFGPEVVVTEAEAGFDGGPAPVPGGERFILTVLGGDRPGTIHGIAGCLARRGVNIVDLHARVDGTRFSLVMEAFIPPDLAPGVVRAETYNEAVELINRNEFANGTAIFTRDGGAARRFQFDVEVGMVGGEDRGAGIVEQRIDPAMARDGLDRAAAIGFVADVRDERDRLGAERAEGVGGLVAVARIADEAERDHPRATPRHLLGDRAAEARGAAGHYRHRIVEIVDGGHALRP